jgi:hypothetical protein
MTEHEPSDQSEHKQGADDREFAPVLRDEEEPAAADADRAAGRPVSGTGVAGVSADHPDTLPPTAEGVREAERSDDTGDKGWQGRPGRPHDIEE